MKKKYIGANHYERKLKKVMNRLKVDEFDFKWDRRSCWVAFYHKNEFYRFDHNIEKAKQSSQDIKYGSDCFAQVVLALEDLARMVERGIYDLSTWAIGMKRLPTETEIPSFFKALGFHEVPNAESEVKTRYRSLAKKMHPDHGGSQEDFQELKKASDQALNFVRGLNQVKRMKKEKESGKGSI